MVKRIAHEGVNYFACNICDFRYADKKTAEECENYCRTHKSCSMEITKHAVKI